LPGGKKETKWVKKGRKKLKRSELETNGKNDEKCRNKEKNEPELKGGK